MGEKEKTNFSLTGIEDDLIKAAVQCPAPYIRPLIFGFSNKVSGTGGRMFNA